MQKKETWAVLGSIGASLAIASCCLAPTLFLLFGVSVGILGSLSALEPLRPWFIAIGGGALSYAVWRTWRPTSVSFGAPCSDADCFQDASPRRRTRWLVAVAFALYVLAIAYPWVVATLL
jgi:mercuric ion transport protein